jgi:CBS domain-containing protein
MRAHQIMTRNVITISPDTTISEAARIMLDNQISGLPVVDGSGKLVGILSDGDFVRRSEIGTQRKAVLGCDSLLDRARPQPNLFTRAGVVWRR